MVRGLGNVELEEVFLENRMDDEGEWFLLQRESASCVFAKPYVGEHVRRRWLAHGMSSSPLQEPLLHPHPLIAQLCKCTDQLHSARKTNYRTRTALLDLQGNFILTQKVLYGIRSQNVLSLDLAPHRC